ncbi:MAG: GntR family transcriptional regulator [Campylobacterota bacterium]|nr:GntR family transcriptional regulator [Campylobacterota bacterium]
MNNDIYNTIKDRILCLEYSPGCILNEKVLAKEFGVSRTPLREVLNRLEWDQLVRVLPRTGTMVTELEFQKIMNAYQVRFGTEEMVGKLAAEHATEEHLQQLVTLHQQCKKLFEVKDRAALVAIDRELRTILNDSANNPVLKNISESLYDLTIRLWCAVLDKGSWHEEVQSVVDEIDQILTTLQSDKKELGVLRRKLLAQHLGRIRKKFPGL